MYKICVYGSDEYRMKKADFSLWKEIYVYFDLYGRKMSLFEWR